MLFEYCKNASKQGDVGEARAIYEYTRLGYTVSRTIFDSAKYDLLIEKDNQIQKVQVKTTTQFINGKYEVDLRTSGTNYSVKRDKDDYDLLFVLSKSDECWSIPSNLIGFSKVSIGDKFIDYKI